MIHFLALSLFSLSGLQLEHHFDVPEYIGHAIFGSGSNDSFWLADRKNSWIKRFDYNGKELTHIFYGSGDGPGEFIKPRNLIELPEQDMLVVASQHGKTLSFNTKTGAFQDNLINFQPYQNSAGWGNSSFIFLWTRKSDDNQASFVVFDHQGKQQESWEVPRPEYQKDYIYEVARGYAVVRNKVYIGHMVRPEIMELSYRKGKPVTWPIHRPKGYIEPPKQKLSRADMFNRKKVIDYVDSFTYMDNIFALNNQYLIVQWNHAESEPMTIDIYRLSDRKRILANHPIEGRIMGTSGNRIFTIHDIEEDDEDRQVVRIFKTRLTE